MTGHEAGSHLEVVKRQNVQGDSVPADDLAGLRDALDYRGDVTVHLIDGQQIEGYLFDLRVGESPAQTHLRVLPKDGSERRTVSVASVKSVEFSGKDPAQGKSWENWLKRYTEKKLAGESAGIESDPLE